MCGRYLLDTEIREIIKTYKILRIKVEEYKTGEIFPSTSAPIIFDSGQRTIAHAKWGFPFNFKKGLVINARSESIMNKPMFKDSFYTARCIVPANLYYEWKDEGKSRKIRCGIGGKTKALFPWRNFISMDDSHSIKQLTLLVLYRGREGIKNIHSRMPLIIRDNDIDAWLDKDADIKHVQRILKSKVNGEFFINRIDDNNSRGTDDEGYQQLKMF